MESESLPNYLRTHRRRTGLSQRALAAILGFKSEGQISRYERLQAMPPLQTALGYEVIFRVPVAKLFTGVHESVQSEIENQLRLLEAKLQEGNGRGPRAATIARLLEWLNGRRTIEK